MLFDDPNLLSNEEIGTQLKQNGYSADLIESIIQQFWIHDWGNSFIANKEYFEVLQKFLAEKKAETFSRFDFYTFFYSTTVPDYEKVSKSLQKIAVVFELMQTDHIAVRDFEEILKELNLTEISLQFLVNAKLITIFEEDEKQIAKWIHHTLTEYLSAIYLLDQKEIIKTVDRFTSSSESGTITFIPSWAGTLRFLVEKDSKTFIDWLEANLKANPDFLNDQLTEVIVFSTPVSIPEGYKTKLFHLVYDSYQEKKWWIPVWAYHNLYKFINAEIYKTLKDNANDTRYEYRANTAATIDGMLRNSHPLLTPGEKDFWKEKLIAYAKEEGTNGVLQRHSLAALENFVGDNSIIEAVVVNDKSTDTLVREAFINMCKVVDPNSAISIGFFIRGISEDTSHIYARNALYSISSNEGIRTLLKGIVENQQFIHEFLDKESIFNKKEKQADEIIIENIRKNLDEENISLIKKLILNAFTGEENYRAGDSYFLQQLALLIKTREPQYLEEIILAIQKLTLEEKNRLFINDFEGVLSVLLEANELARLKEVFNDTLHHHSKYTFAEAIRLAPRNGNPNGESVLQKGIELGITVDPNKLPKYEDHLKERELGIYKQFRKYLSPPTKGQYFPQVFAFFVENQKVIESQMSDDEIQRLLELAIDSNLNKIDPEKIVVRYKDQENKTGEYTITSVAGHFADVLRLIYKLKPDILQTPENRRKVINFIPFAYSNDFKIIQDILGTVNDKELSTLNEIMLNDKNDARYLVPQTYIYFSKIFPNLKSPRVVLISFIKDKYISESDKDYALKTLENYITNDDRNIEKLLLTIWNPKERKAFSDSANAALVSIFRNEVAILWRFKILKDSAKPFHRQEGAHSVGTLEMELDYLAFAKPLIDLRDEKYLKQFIELLDFSLTLNADEQYKEYTNYLWRIAIAFVVRDDFFLSETAYESLKKWADKNKETPNINWFNKRLEMALTESKSARTRKNKVSEAIAVLNHE
ncbi:hypothetical protein A2773_01645 [Candidatus Gottesmanbacteria bacterium RIFCSPHIGHO2_01_FULL_39_10]|uniref:Uncharacterized protein n=1 Tax=Candidatus Gottesmanbacteria bacterium RIFCSPHIGHO2_01_FULL_39_10 TaxID=1798375 RepID=A0A1F5ZKQ0_9BACT|nr:MAG: hypothetical protein A2773_01645 [Candidatus Gottesmanbacteria bacterium RIFCSPHIGHO2_01_FULL_39_10]